MIVQYWHDGKPPEEVAELIAGLRRLNPDIEHRLFDERAAAELIGERYGERELAAFRACAVPAMQADYFRYCAVHALGGVYADVDLRCLGSLRPLLEGPSAGTLFGRPELPPRWRLPELEWRERRGPYRAVINSLFAFPAPRHPLPGLAAAIATAAIERRLAGDVWLVTGPAIFTSLYLLREVGSLAALDRYLAGGALAPLSPVLRAAIGDERAVERAVAGVAVRPIAEAHEHVADERELAYKRSGGDWAGREAEIYR